MTPHEWFQLLYDGATTGYLTISHKRDAGARSDPADPFATRWVLAHDTAGAGREAEALAADCNVWFGLGVRRDLGGDMERGTSEDVIALPCLWMELDVKPGAFESKEAIVSFLRTLPLQPSAIIDSGHGLHAYWIFKELWYFDNDERDYVAALVRGWQGFVRSRAGNVKCDFTHDLARVLRVPGTFNRKGDEVLPVTSVLTDGPRYNPSDFDEWQDWSKTTTRDVPRDFVVRSGAQAPTTKFMALLENDPRSKKAWEETLRGLADDSPSTFAMVLANAAVQAGWTNQEIADLLVAFREKRPRENKKSAGWYAITIAVARQGSRAQSVENVRRLSATTEPDEVCAIVSKMVGFRIIRFKKMRPIDPTGDLMPAFYIIETEAGNIVVQDTAIWLSHQRMKELVYDRLSLTLHTTAKEWPAVTDAFRKIQVEEECALESSHYEEVRLALAEYLRRQSKSPDPITAADGNCIYEPEGGAKMFNLTRFGNWCRVQRGMKLGPRNLAPILERIGCKKITLQNLRRGDKLTSLHWWTEPREVEN